jgi:squalene cyclase
MELMDRETITKAIDWIHSVQRPDGSWYGSWYVPPSSSLLLHFEAEAEEAEEKEKTDEKGNMLYIRYHVRLGITRDRRRDS